MLLENIWLIQINFQKNVGNPQSEVVAGPLPEVLGQGGVGQPVLGDQGWEGPRKTRGSLSAWSPMMK